METIDIINSTLFLLSLLGLLSVFLFNPLSIWIRYIIKGEKPVRCSTIKPRISVLTVVHNAESLIAKKIENTLSLNYPSDSYEVVIFSDGSTDQTENIVKTFSDSHIRFLSFDTHEGKNKAINEAIRYCSGDIIIFSDADTFLTPETLTELVKYFNDPVVGGVCGMATIYEDKEKKLKEAQGIYLKFDALIKKLESQTGSISSNSGKIYAVRRDLFPLIPPAVTDDLYVCLHVVQQGYRFLFEPKAKAFIKVPSRNSAHEIRRRRRITTRSLHGIYLKRSLLNPFKYGLFSIHLSINKIVRRFIPVFLVFMLVSNLFLFSLNPIFKIALFLQASMYALAFLYWTLFQHISRLSFLKKTSSAAFYFFLGNYGVLLGLLDFTAGKKVTKWEPLKRDN